MDKNTRFAAVNTKIRGMKKELLTKENYLELLKMRTVSEAAVYLKENTHYRRVLSGENPAAIYRSRLEQLVKSNIINNVDKITHYFNGSYKSFIKSLYAKYEIEDLKVFARAVYNNLPIEESMNSAFIGKYSKIDTMLLFQSRSIKDIVLALKGSAFYKYVSHLIDGMMPDNLFRFEMSLDMAYYSLIQKEWSKLEKSDIKLLEKAQGLIADLLNLQWIYRGIKFYNLLPEELLNYTINIGFRLKYEFIKKLCYAGNLKEFYDLVHTTRYKFLFKNDDTTDIYMERRMDRHLYYELNAMCRSYSMSIICLFVYIQILEFETRDVISIIEAIKYNLSVEEAQKYIVINL